MRKRIVFRGLLVLSLSVCTSCNKHKESIYSITFQSMGTVVKISLPDGYKNATKEVKNMMDTITELMSKYKHTSDISRLNRSQGQWIEVSSHTLKVLKKAVEICKRTGGYFNPAIFGVYRLWDMASRNNAFPSRKTIVRALAGSSCNSVHFYGGKVKVDTGAMVDVGGIAKGYTLDLAWKIFKKAGTPWAVVNAGGDDLLYGHRRRTWTIGVVSPALSEKIAAVLEVKNFEFICTSGGYERYFRVGTQRLPHIINPLTGFPARYFKSVTVLAHNGMLCDAIATAVFAGGSKALETVISEWGEEIKVIII